MTSKGPWFRASKNAWYVWHEGRMVSLGVKGEGSKSEAVKAWHRLKGGVPLKGEASKPDPERRREPPMGKDALPGLVKAFLANAEHRVKTVSLKGYAMYLSPFGEAFKGTPIDRITPCQVERYSRKPEWSTSYRSGFIGVVISLFKWAVETGRIDHNPIIGIRKPPKASRGVKALVSGDDHARLCQHAEPMFRALLELLWLTGARPGEIASLTAEQIVKAADGVIVYDEHKTAHLGKVRLIVLTPEALAVAKERAKAVGSGLLFPGEDGQRLTAQAVGKRVFRLCRKAGVKALAYGYRHTFATDALANGVPDAQVAALLGHSGTAMLHKHYAHLTARTQTLKDALANVR